MQYNKCRLSWELLSEDYAMPQAVEHADPTIRYVDSDGCVLQNQLTRTALFNIALKTHYEPESATISSTIEQRSLISWK